MTTKKETHKEDLKEETAAEKDSAKEVSQEEQGARRKILEAAAQLFAVNGMDGTSTRDIAKESGLNLSLISYYFGGKEGLYVAVIRDFAMRIHEKVELVVQRFGHIELDEKALREMISSILDIFLEMRLENPNAGRIMAREKLAGMPYSKDVHEQIFVEVGEKVKSLILRGQKQGFVNKKINPDFFLYCLAESVAGYFVMLDSKTIAPEIVHKCYNIPSQREEFKNQLMMLFLEGILK
jgi:AcrR family transcriptional regulator